MGEPILRKGVRWPFTVVGLLSDLDPGGTTVTLPAGASGRGAFGDIVNDRSVVADGPCVPYRGHSATGGNGRGNGTLL